MKKIDLGQSLGILANIGVIAGIVFLGIEIRESGTQARIATTQEMVAQRSEWREFLASDEALSDIYMRGIKDVKQLTPLERLRFDLLIQSFLHKMSASFIARDEQLIGLNPDLYTRGLEGELFRLLDEPGFRDWWSSADLRGLTPGFIERMDELLTLREPN